MFVKGCRRQHRNARIKTRQLLPRGLCECCGLSGGLDHQRDVAGRHLCEWQIEVGPGRIVKVISWSVLGHTKWTATPWKAAWPSANMARPSGRPGGISGTRRTSARRLVAARDRRVVRWQQHRATVCPSLTSDLARDADDTAHQAPSIPLRRASAAAPPLRRPDDASCSPR